MLLISTVIKNSPLGATVLLSLAHWPSGSLVWVADSNTHNFCSMSMWNMMDFDLELIYYIMNWQMEEDSHLPFNGQRSYSQASLTLLISMVSNMLCSVWDRGQKCFCLCCGSKLKDVSHIHLRINAGTYWVDPSIDSHNTVDLSNVKMPILICLIAHKVVNPSIYWLISSFFGCCGTANILRKIDWLECVFLITYSDNSFFQRNNYSTTYFY